MIERAILKLVWTIFIQGPLAIIDAFNSVLTYLTGGIINDILFGSSTEFQWNNIPMQFWWFVVMALCLFGLIFSIQMIILIFQESVETKTKFVLALQNAVKGFSFMFLIPIFFFLANFIVQNLANTVINHFGDNNSTLAKYLWHIGDPDWSPGNGTITAPADFGPPGNIKSYNMIIQLFGTWFMLFAILAIGLILVQKIIELFFLFVISPIIMVIMVVDSGKAAFTWKDMVIAKFLASTATLIGYYIFIAVTQILISSGLKSFDGPQIGKSIFMILFFAGGGMATWSFSDIIASFIGESVGIREGMASMRTTMAGGMMAMGAGKVAMRAMGFAKSKRAGKGSGLSGLNPFSSNKEEQASEGSGLNFSTFRYATSGLSSRSGIMGLAGLTLGAAAVGFSNYRAGSTAVGRRAGLKNLGKGIGKSVSKPFVSVGKTLNPGIVSFSKKKISAEQKQISANQIQNIGQEVKKQRKLVKNAQKNNPDLVPQVKKNLKKLENNKLNLHERKSKYKIPDEKSKMQKRQERSKKK